MNSLRISLAIIAVFNFSISSAVVAGQSAAYRWNEEENQLGANRCSFDYECDGLRTCSDATWCTGIARPSKSTYYGHNEGINLLGAHRCEWDYDCDGLRTCSVYGWCQGIAR